MKLDELKEDLNKKCEGRYFNQRLFKNEEHYGRRSFDDLFKYYKRYKVTEKMLIQALYECKFSALVCEDLGKCVFFKFLNQTDKFWGSYYGISNFGYSTYRVTRNTKYTEEYLNNLFNEIY